MLAVVPDERLTHYLEEVDFPETAVQSFYVTHPHEQPNGLPRLSLMAIHVPQQALQRLTLPVHQPGALYVGKARRLGLDGGPAGPRPAEPVMDLADYVDMTEAAKLIVFHHPELDLPGIPHTLLAATLAYIEKRHALLPRARPESQRSGSVASAPAATTRAGPTASICWTSRATRYPTARAAIAGSTSTPRRRGTS